MKYKKVENRQLTTLLENKGIVSAEKKLDIPSLSKKVSILFRNSIPEIPSTTYGTFAIYKYPAKFIPQVIAYALKKYAKPGMKIFDPFAGYGTVGLVARIYGYDYELWDLNPIIETIHKSATLKKSAIKPRDLIELLEELKKSQKEFIPKWTNLDYWFPQEFLATLSKAWGFVHSLSEDTKHFFLIPLLNTTKYFSWTDEKVHKLYKSKYSRRKIESLLKRNWPTIFYKMLRDEVFRLFNKISEYEKLQPKLVNFKIKSGVDILETQLNEPVNILITSPPYLQAQEYIRSTKLELFWLGYDENYIRNLGKKEIPYRDVDEIEIHSKKYYKFREKIKEPHLKVLYERYFKAILGTFSKLGEKVENYMCIFVGPAKIRTMPVPIDE
ncbi:MAG: hypothetical protein ACPLZ9_06705, partial [Candidatus Ratteibacteria bacterium]